MYRVGLAGAQDTGKTTLARGLASHFSAKGYIAEYVPEYAREYIGQHGPLAGGDVLVTLKQIEKELLVTPNANVMFTDSPVFLSYIYTLLAGLDTRNLVLLDAELNLITRHPAYDLIIHLEPFRTPRADGIRTPELIAKNDQIARRIKGFLDLYELPYITLTTTSFPTLDDRMAEAIKVIQQKLDEQKLP